MKEALQLQISGLAAEVRIDELFAANFDAYFIDYYSKKQPSLLNSLCEKYGSDKGSTTQSGHCYPWPAHSYADYLERLFNHCRHFITNVFECGLGTNNPNLPSSMGEKGKPGASLRVWRDYFPNATIVGADVDKNILFSDERIQTFHCDQTNPQSISDLWRKFENLQFDLMIDDGLHTFEAGKCLYENSVQKLRAGGIYIIEDVSITSLISYKKYFDAQSANYEFVNLYRKGLPLNDNSLVVIRKN